MSHFIPQNDSMVQRAFQHQYNKDNRTDINRLWRRVNELSTMANPPYGGGLQDGTGTGVSSGPGSGTGSGTGCSFECGEGLTCDPGYTYCVNGGTVARCIWEWDADLADWFYVGGFCTSAGTFPAGSCVCSDKPVIPGCETGDRCYGICCYPVSGSGTGSDGSCPTPVWAGGTCTYTWDGMNWSSAVCTGAGICPGYMGLPGAFVGDIHCGCCAACPP